jgi:hypothetical protein
MCGRFKRKFDKMKVAKAFEVTAGIEEADFAPGGRPPPVTLAYVPYC